jgi:hypothetical protein
MTSANELIDRARSATGLEYLGEDSFRDGLERLVESARSEAVLNEAGRAAFEGQCVMLLSRRLEIEDWYARHPEIDDQQILAPVIVLGLPRSGSTALHCLLGEDPAFRVIRNWEGMQPCPPPETTTQDSDPRIAMMQQAMERRDRMTPRMKQMVPSSATSPVEDQLLMAQDFKSHFFAASFRVPSYVEWLNHEADLVPTFKWVERVLKLLQWRCGPQQWLLKNPNYPVFVDALDTVWPDARYCMTHRDVASVIPSVADLYSEMHGPNTARPDKAWMGAMNADWCELGMRRLIAFRDSGNEHRFFDAQFLPLQQDPFPVIEQLYAFLGLKLTRDALDRMEKWRREQPRGKHGIHEYDARDFGLDPATLRERFRFYSERFGVASGSV